jgi:sugar lactone lactonase YvrE
MRTLFSTLILSALVFISCSKSNDGNNNPNPSSLTITSISPDNGPMGTTVTINGTGFSTVAAENTVKFNGEVATIENATATQLKVKVPGGAGNGVVTVTKGSQTVNGPNFTYVLSAVVSTLAGNSNEGFVNGTGSNAKFNYPVGICIDGSGNIYVGDAFNHAIRKVTQAGVVTTFAGGTQGFSNGTGTGATFNLPGGMCIDAAGNFYTGDIANYAIRKISASAAVTTLAGGSEGNANGQGVAAQFDMPIAVCADAQGNIYVADNSNHIIRKITPTGLVSVFAGSGVAGNADGTGTAAQFEEPYGICADAQGNIYVVDNVSSRIRKITSAGVVTTIAGSAGTGFQDGNLSVAKFDQPNGICIDAQGNLYVTDYNNNRIRKITPAGVVSTLAGSQQGFEDGPAAQAKFYKPGHICLDNQGNLYVADRYNHRIRKIAME